MRAGIGVNLPAWHDTGELHGEGCGEQLGKLRLYGESGKEVTSVINRKRCARPGET